MTINVVEWLENSAMKYGDKIALKDKDNYFTYKEYREKSLSIARCIVDLGFCSQIPVAVFMDKSILVLSAFMGIAYSGNFYVPIETDIPVDRINSIIKTLDLQLIITTRKYKETLIAYGFKGSFLIYEDCVPDKSDFEIIKSRYYGIIDTDLLYVLFTSGSTGTPKGVAVRHKSVIDYMDWVVEKYNIDSRDSFANLAPFSFDGSLLDIYATLKSGATLYIMPNESKTFPRLMTEYIYNHKISVIVWVPSALILVSKLKALDGLDLSKTLRLVIFCGEEMSSFCLKYWQKKLPNVKYSYQYGPTEATYACTYFDVDHIYDSESKLPIGKPMRNTRIYIMDSVGTIINELEKIGEICIGGTSLAAGYYNDSKRTKEVFVLNPQQKNYEEIIYKTGDLGYFDQDMNLIFCGRNDSQIKHMGHRIELGEIEHAANLVSCIDMSCCVYDTKKKKIVLFVQIKNQFVDDKNVDNIIAELSNKLPGYMLPESIIVLDDIPINKNGKIDRKLLMSKI